MTLNQRNIWRWEFEHTWKLLTVDIQTLIDNKISCEEKTMMLERIVTVAQVWIILRETMIANEPQDSMEN
jgi:hypothetical protein